MEATIDNAPHPARDVLVLSAAGIAVRAAFAFGTAKALDSADAIHYVEAAKHFAAGSFASVEPGVPPLYPLLAAVAHTMGLDPEMACIATSFFASIFLIPLVYLLARDLHGTRAARIAGLTVALWPWLVDYAGRVGPDALGCTLWCASIWLLARAMRRGGLSIAAAALAFTALHLARAEGLFFFLASPVIAFAFLRGPDGTAARRLAVFFVVTLLLMALCAAAAKATLGHVPAGYRIVRIIQDWGVTPFEVAKMRQVADAPTTVATRYVLIPLARSAFKTLFDVLPIMLGPVLMVFIGAGFFLPGRPRDLRLEGFVLAFAFLQWALILPVLSPEPRYLMAPLVVLSLWAARGIAAISGNMRPHRYRRWLAPLPAGILVANMTLGLAVMAAAQHLQTTPGEPREYKMAGQWMKEHLAPALLFTRKPQIGYYADMPSTGPDLQDTLEKAIDRARHVGARYFVVDERYTAHMVPALAPLLDPANAPPGLVFLKSFAPFPQGRVVIYELAASP